VRSIDAAGNTDATPASRAFTVTASGGSGGSTGGSTGTPSAPTTPTTPPDTPPSSGGPTVTPDLTAPNLTIATSKTRAHRNRITLRLRCPTSEPGGCLGTVVVKSGRTVAGRKAFRVAGGRTASITIALTRSAARVLARHSRLRVTASAAVRDLAGNRKTVRRSLVILR
jgi:hypothetical protein